MSFFGYTEQASRIVWLRQGGFLAVITALSTILSIVLSMTTQYYLNIPVESTLPYLMLCTGASMLGAYMWRIRHSTQHWISNLEITPLQEKYIESIIKDISLKLNIPPPLLMISSQAGINSMVYEDNLNTYLVLTPQAIIIEHSCLELLLIHGLLQIKHGDGYRNAQMFRMVDFLTHGILYDYELQHYSTKFLKIIIVPIQLFIRMLNIPIYRSIQFLVQDIKVFSIMNTDMQCLSNTTNAHALIKLLTLCSDHNEINNIKSQYLWFDAPNTKNYHTHPTIIKRIDKAQKYGNSEHLSTTPIRLPEFAITSLRTVHDACYVLHQYIIEMYPNTPFDLTLDIGRYKQIHKVWSEITINQKIGMLFRAMHLIYTGSDVGLKNKWNKWMAQHYQQLKTAYLFVAWSLQQPTINNLPSTPWALIPWLSPKKPEFHWYNLTANASYTLVDLQASLMMLPRLSTEELNNFWGWLNTFNIHPPLIQQACLIYIRRKKS